MKTKVSPRPLDIEVRDGEIFINQTEEGNFYVAAGNLFSNSLIVDRKGLEALIRAGIWIKNEVDGKNE